MTNRSAIFGFRVNQDERRLIKALANRLQRTQSDALRLIVREAAAGLLQDGAEADQSVGSGEAACQG